MFFKDTLSLNQCKGKKFIRRPDLHPETRLHIAYMALYGQWGIITSLAEEFRISRTFIYLMMNDLMEIAEKVFGKRLPSNTEVHHVDINRSNDENNNLVICQDRKYHNLLHKRKRAYDACGHPDWIKCQICLEYGPPEEIKSYKSSNSRWHSKCWAKRCRERRSQK